jgi:hypothetical protein
MAKMSPADRNKSLVVASSSTRWLRALRPSKYDQTLAANVNDAEDMRQTLQNIDNQQAERISKKALLVMIDKMDTTKQKQLLDQMVAKDAEHDSF